MRVRGFEVVSSFEGRGINLPERKTLFSAGYDIEAAADMIIAPGEVILVPTGIKAYMLPSEYLGVHVRSSVAVKRKLFLANSQGIIDADYYNNPDNEGHIFVPLFNAGDSDAHIKKGERIAQGIFYDFHTTDDDRTSGKHRVGGCGSTN